MQSGPTTWLWPLRCRVLSRSSEQALAEASQTSLAAAAEAPDAPAGAGPADKAAKKAAQGTRRTSLAAARKPLNPLDPATLSAVLGEPSAACMAASASTAAGADLLHVLYMPYTAHLEASPACRRSIMLVLSMSGPLWHCPSLGCAHTGAVATKEGASAVAELSSGLLRPAAMALLNAIKYSQAEGTEGDPTTLQRALGKPACGMLQRAMVLLRMLHWLGGHPSCIWPLLRWPVLELHTGQGLPCAQPCWLLAIF